MKILRGFDNPECYRSGYLSIGNLDGVHRGHQKMVSTLVARAQDTGVPAVILTFDPHPIALLRPQQTPPSLSTFERKAELLSQLGVDCLIACPTNQQLLQLSAEEFFESIVIREINSVGLVEGPNFRFGRDREGSIELLNDFCDRFDRTLDIVAPVLVGDQLVSSSRIRQLISEGNVLAAVGLLGHPYRLRGKVGKGQHRGTNLGFPTANLADVETLFPAEGVYAGRCAVDGVVYPTAVNIGANPTFKESQHKIEAHLIGFDGNLYGRELCVDLLGRVRDTRPFSSIEELQQQIKDDIEQVRRRFISSEPDIQSSQNSKASHHEH